MYVLKARQDVSTRQWRIVRRSSLCVQPHLQSAIKANFAMISLSGVKTYSKLDENKPPPAPPLDTSLFRPSPQEWEFLRSAVSSDDCEVERRVLEVQKELFEVHTYPCIRFFHFTNLIMSSNPAYSTVLEAGKKGNAFLLDIGCCMGTDARKLVQDGFPAHNIVGCDLRDTFIESGYKLFNDREECQINFITGDIFEVPPEAAIEVSSIPINEVQTLGDLKGRLSYIYAGALFHLFTEEPQYAIALRLIPLLKNDSPCIIFGRHLGQKVATIVEDFPGRKKFEHSPDSWKAMWRRAFTEANGGSFADTHVSVNAQLLPFESGEGNRDWLFWSVSVN